MATTIFVALVFFAALSVIVKTAKEKLIPYIILELINKKGRACEDSIISYFEQNHAKISTEQILVNIQILMDRGWVTAKRLTNDPSDANIYYVITDTGKSALLDYVQAQLEK